MNKKQVKFLNQTYVYLIPENNSDLWYDPSDYLGFREAFREQIATIMNRHKTDMRTARNILNKTHIVYNDSFFDTPLKIYTLEDL